MWWVRYRVHGTRYMAVRNTVTQRQTRGGNITTSRGHGTSLCAVRGATVPRYFIRGSPSTTPSYPCNAEQSHKRTPRHMQARGTIKVMINRRELKIFFWVPVPAPCTTACEHSYHSNARHCLRAGVRGRQQHPGSCSVAGSTVDAARIVDARKSASVHRRCAVVRPCPDAATHHPAASLARSSSGAVPCGGGG